MTGSGQVGAAELGIVESLKEEDCTSGETTTCPNPVAIQAVNVNWRSDIVGGSDVFTNSTGIAFSYTCRGRTAITCSTLGTSAMAELSNGAGFVRALFLVRATSLLCNPHGGREGQGTVIGAFEIALTNGEELSIS